MFFICLLSVGGCVLMRMWRLAVMSCVCPLSNYTLATEKMSVTTSLCMMQSLTNYMK